MNPAEAFQELLVRIGASRGEAVLVSEEELSEWPETAVHAMKKAGLLTPASPATSAVCPGCEQQCHMVVHTPPARAGKSDSFIVCDKRDDISRVAVPDAMLRQWGASPTAIAGLVARLLGVANGAASSSERCEIGVVKGRRHSSHVVLVADGGLNLHLAGHTVALTDLLKLESKSFRVDKQAVIRLVDRPIAGAGDQESARQRRERLAKLIRAEKAKGNRAFLKSVATGEGISISRLKQILQGPSKGIHGARYSRY